MDKDLENYHCYTIFRWFKWMKCISNIKFGGDEHPIYELFWWFFSWLRGFWQDPCAGWFPWTCQDKRLQVAQLYNLEGTLQHSFVHGAMIGRMGICSSTGKSRGTYVPGLVNVYTLRTWKWLLIVDLPIKNGDFPSFFVCLPEGNVVLGYLLIGDVFGES